jgi:hypothetical protein
MQLRPPSPGEHLPQMGNGTMRTTMGSTGNVPACIHILDQAVEHPRAAHARGGALSGRPASLLLRCHPLAASARVGRIGVMSVTSPWP